MKRKNAIIILIISMGFGMIEAANAQSAEKGSSLPTTNEKSGNFALGIRAGETSGITLKSYQSDKVALEGILGIWSNGFSFTGLYEITQTLEPKGLSFYYGIGGHIAAGKKSIYYDKDRYFLYRYRASDPAFGIDGIVGLEFKVPQIPLAISFDLKPLIELNSNGYGRFGLDPGLGIKVIF